MLVLVWMLGLLLVGRKGAPRGAVIVLLEEEVAVVVVEEVVLGEEDVWVEAERGRHDELDPHS